MLRRPYLFIVVTLTMLLALAGCGDRPTLTSDPSLLAAPTVTPHGGAATGDHGTTDSGAGGTTDSATQPTAPASGEPAAQSGETVTFTLETITENGFAYRGIGGDIDGVVNPELRVPAGATVEIVLVNSDGVQHDIVIDAFGVKSPPFMGETSEERVSFVANQTGTFEYYCSIPGHKQAGMFGTLIVEGELPEGMQAGTGTTPYDQDAPAVVGHPPAIKGAPLLAADPAVLPPPIGNREATTIEMDIISEERVGQLADGTTYEFWTFNGTAPGPMLRVRVGDTINLRFRNGEDSAFPHSIDFHAATGYLGGGSATQTMPGGETLFTWKALQPGVYIYHCATAMVPHHIANGMYGIIVVEPEGGLPPVDREFYVVQGEIYTDGAVGDKGHLAFDLNSMLDENPNYMVFNGSTDALTKDMALRANVGETVRIYMGVGGPNLTSSFHVIGEIFDRVYHEGSLTSPPLLDVQTTTVAPGGATMVEFKVDQPGTYILVDHALGRLVKGLKAFLIVEGPHDPTISDGVESGGEH